MTKVAVEVKPNSFVAVAEGTTGVEGLVGTKLLAVLVQAMGMNIPPKVAMIQKAYKKSGLKIFTTLVYRLKVL